MKKVLGRKTKLTHTQEGNKCVPAIGGGRKQQRKGVKKTVSFLKKKIFFRKLMAMFLLRFLGFFFKLILIPCSWNLHVQYTLKKNTSKIKKPENAKIGLNWDHDKTHMYTHPTKKNNQNNWPELDVWFLILRKGLKEMNFKKKNEIRKSCAREFNLCVCVCVCLAERFFSQREKK